METYPYKCLSKEAVKELEDFIKNTEKRITNRIIEYQKTPEQKLENLIGSKLRIHIDEGF